jgi:type IV secretory pathway TraG/TraD family ATPase VirD4
MDDGGHRGGFLGRLLTRAFLLFLVLAIGLEWNYRELRESHALPRSIPGPLAARLIRRLRIYGYWRAWCMDNAWLLLICFVAVTAIGIVGIRQALLFWNRIKGRVSGTTQREAPLTFPMTKVDLVHEISRRPAGYLFVGMTPRKSFLGWRWKPVYLSSRQRTTHRHVIGKTGSGKTSSVLWPSVLQDVLDGKGVLVISGKGSDEELRTMKAIAAIAKRTAELRVFSLPSWNAPQLFSHTYNMVHVRPRTAEDPGGDPVAMAQRVFSVLPMGTNEFFKTQAEVMFTNVCRLLHGMVDEAENGLAFVVRDISVCLKAIGNVGSWKRALDHCLDNSVDREAAEEVRAQVRQLDREVLRTLSGLVGALEKYQSPIVNAYAPDVVFEDVLQSNGLVYVQLPANLFRIQAPALGKLILMDVQQEGSLRQVFRSERNQTPFAVTVDEFYNFADISIVDSLNKLRDAHVEYTIAHQSLADLELVSREFAAAVWDNTLTKDILHQDNPELCERIAKSLGTRKVNELTVRRRQGPLLTNLATGEASSRRVETYRLHPNSIKSLARCGQGYLLSDEGILPVAYGMLPPTISADYKLPRNRQRDAHGLRLYETFIVNSQPRGNASVP